MLLPIFVVIYGQRPESKAMGVGMLSNGGGEKYKSNKEGMRSTESACNGEDEKRK